MHCKSTHAPDVYGKRLCGTTARQPFISRRPDTKGVTCQKCAKKLAKQADTQPPKATPWGTSQHERKIADGIWSVSPVSHGGLWLAQWRQDMMPAAFLEETWTGLAAWFEEDCDWAMVADVFPSEFPPEHVAIARTTMERSHSEIFAAFNTPFAG